MLKWINYVPYYTNEQIQNNRLCCFRLGYKNAQSQWMTGKSVPRPSTTPARYWASPAISHPCRHIRCWLSLPKPPDSWFFDSKYRCICCRLKHTRTPPNTRFNTNIWNSPYHRGETGAFLPLCWETQISLTDMVFRSPTIKCQDRRGDILI
jgi:hypothetical protein